MKSSLTLLGSLLLILSSLALGDTPMERILNSLEAGESSETEASELLVQSVTDYDNVPSRYTEGTDAAPCGTPALLEAMQEQNVTVSGHTYRLSPPFIVLATQNPIEMEGTYPLPEAQLDRFFFKLKVEYPEFEDMRTIVDRTTGGVLDPLRRMILPPGSGPHGDHRDWDTIQAWANELPAKLK